MVIGEQFQQRPLDAVPFVLPAQLVLGSSVLAMVCVTTSGEILSANRTFCRLLGAESLPELLGKDFKTDVLADAAQWARWEAAAAPAPRIAQDVAITTTTGQVVHLHGEIRLVNDSVNPSPYLAGIFTDVTKHMQIQGALQRAGRMEMVGALAGGIMHDLNNLLTILVGNLYLVGEAVRGDPAVFEKTKRARDAAKRGTDLTRQLLSFARADSDGCRRVNLAELMTNLEPLLSRAMGARIELTTDIGADIAPVMADPAQVESVVVNLTKNAADAIDGDGKICIRVANTRVDAARRGALGLSSRRCVGISVADNGPGIPEAIKDKIFEPFFSTKGKSRGTGLGLSMVRWIAKELDGTIEFDTAPGRGTTFTLLLPATALPSSETPADSTMPLSTLPTGTETTLVIADDPQLRQTVKESLEILGYRVICSDGLRDPLEELPATGIHLLLIDRAIQHGNEILEAIRTRVPSIRIVSIGESDVQRSDDDDGASIVKMPQPFALIDIARTVRKTLDGAVNAQ